MTPPAFQGNEAGDRGQEITQSITLATEGDTAQMLAIYAPIVLDTPISFEVELPSERGFQERLKATLDQLLWLVCEAGGVVLGYA